MSDIGIHILLATLILEGFTCVALICIGLRRGQKGQAAGLAALLVVLCLLIVVCVPNTLQQAQR
ncbi:hypothetical protein [Streptomyces fagopyri]|uniref:hypothetical protein n=1 Tax=Streptomyces fagopyri TaxID=2662397 RepID=UPI00381360FF